MRYASLPTLVAFAALLYGCCSDHPDLCSQGELLLDAGVPAPACWTAATAPLRTESSVAEPALSSILGCLRLDDGWCQAGAAGDEGAPYRREEHAPSGAWVTSARGFGCPSIECDQEVGRAEAFVGPRVRALVGHPAAIEYVLVCEPPPGRPSLPAVPDPHTDEVRPAWMVDCLEGVPLYTTRMANGRWRVRDIDEGMWTIDGGRRRRWTGVERAAAVAGFMACTQRRCASLNTWTEPQRDPDLDGVQTRCDVCPDTPDPGQADQDGDRVGDACDGCPSSFDPWQTDADRDGVGDVCDVCPANPDGEQRERDGDGIGDACDVCPERFDPAQNDRDGDSVGDVCDRCPDVADVDQADGDADGIGDACDVCPGIADVAQVDTDADGAGDACDDDDDGDDVSDTDEGEDGTDPLNPDTDADGHPDGEDNCPLEPNPGQEEADDPSNGRGDACDLPLPPEDDHPDAPPTADQIVWIDAVPLRPDRTVGAVLFDFATAIIGRVAAGYFEAPQVISEVPDVPDPDQPPARRGSGWAWIDRLVQEVEDHTGQTLGIVLGRAYEQWAGNTYCDSNAHRQAFSDAGLDPDEACRREVSIGRLTHDFDNPQRLMGMMKRRLRNGQIQVYRFERKRRHDCHCRGIPGVIPPLSEEYKASRSQHPFFRRRYREWLIAQCKDYRFTLALLMQRAFPHIGDLRTVYDKLNRSMRRDRPTLLYRLFRDTLAMQQVLGACRFDEFPEDTGLMPEAEVARRRAADPEVATAQAQWRINRPGWLVPPDGVLGCGGERVHHYVGWGCPVAGAGLAAPDHFAQCPPEDRELGLFTRCTPGLELDEDPFSNQLRMDFETGFGKPSLHAGASAIGSSSTFQGVARGHP